MEDHLKEIIYNPISKFMRENIIYLSWSPDFALDAPIYGRESDKFHLGVQHEICPHFYANPYKDYHNLSWTLRIFKNCNKKCPDNTCLALENNSLNLGSFKISITFAFEKKDGGFCNFQQREFWISSTRHKFHGIAPAEKWKTTHVFFRILT